jgi:predicted outer membrane repeat protein
MIMRAFTDSWTVTLTKLGLKKSPRRARGCRPRNAFRRPLRVEGLEERRMLATLMVNNLDDDTHINMIGGLTLREAIEVVNQGTTAGLDSGTIATQISGTLGNNDTIKFAESLFAAGFRIHQLGASLGELQISNDVTIVGPGPDLLTIDARATDLTPDSTTIDEIGGDGDGTSIFHIFGLIDTNVSISGLALTEADGPNAGAIFSDGVSLALDDLWLYDNQGFTGGGIRVEAAGDNVVTISNSIIGHDNKLLANASYSNGGGISVNMTGGVVTLTGLLVRNNATLLGSGGGGIAVQNGYALNPPGDFTLQDSVITGNTAGGLILGSDPTQSFGGGVFVQSVLNGNETTSPGSIRFIRNSISHNEAIAEGGGIAFFLKDERDSNPINPTMEVEIVDTTIHHNRAYGRWSVGLESEAGGGGILVSTSGKFRTVITNSTISTNRAPNGGGVMLKGQNTPDELASDVEIRHSTITGNKAGPFDPLQYMKAGGNSYRSTFGGGIGISLDDYVRPNLLLDHTILAGNIHDQREPLHEETHFDDFLNYSPDVGIAPYPSLKITDHLNPVALLPGDPGYHSYVVDTANTIIGDVGKHYDWGLLGITGDYIRDDPWLGPLGDNGAWFTLPDGSKIQTHGITEPLLSAAVDRGATSGDFPEFDERGAPYVRVYDAANDGTPTIDIGAFEWQPIIPEPCPPGDYNNDGTVDAADYVVWRKNYNMAVFIPNDLTPGFVGLDDFDVWRANFGATCETPPIVQSIQMLTVNSPDANSDYDFFDLSLREALLLAADEVNYPGADLIVIAPWVSDILMNGVAFVIDSDVSIVGPGADEFAIDGDLLSRIFTVNIGIDATIQGMTLERGKVTGSNDGGAIRNSGNLTLNSVLFEQDSTARHGGAIHSTGTLRVTDSTFTGNLAANMGGAISVQSSATDALVVEGSTFFENDALDGGAIRIHGSNGSGTATIVNSTLSGNTAAQNAGGIRLTSVAPALTIINSTITLNQADTNTTDGVSGQGGGIHIGGGSVTLHNSIVAANTAASTAGNDIHGAVESTSDYNLLGTGEQGSQPGSHNVWTNNPGLAPLGDYGGPTKAHALLSSSLAIDKGSDAQAMFGGVALVRDQRGFARNVDAGTSGPTGGTVDIGAFEYAAPIIVSTRDDENDGVYAPTKLSLREAIELAGVLEGDDTIEFAPGLAGSIVLQDSLGELVIDSNVEILGPGKDVLTIDADENSRVMSVAGGITAAIVGMTLSGGDTTGFGGAIYSQGDLTIRDLAISGNSANQGGGIYQLGGQLSISSSAIFDNQAGSLGGGIYSNDASSTTIDSSAIYLNSANLFGGLAIADGVADIRNSTISTNTANLEIGAFNFTGTSATLSHVTMVNNVTTGGAIGGMFKSSGSTVTLNNTILINNTAGSTESNVSGSLAAASSHNLLRTGSSGGLSETNGNILLDAMEDAGIDALGDFGGPTWTHALLEDSPAIDAGDDAIAEALELLFDQRGNNRKEDGDGDAVAQVDIGAFELALES